MCRWCPATGKCTAAMHCPSTTVSVCPEKNGPPSPASISIDNPKNISLPVKHLPQPDGFEKSEECVHIKRPSQLSVPRGSSQEISFSVAHLSRLPTDRDYSCRILLDGVPVSAKAVLLKESVKCMPMRLSYLDPLPNVTAPLEFMQDEDVVDSTEVLVYSCSMLAADCSSCVYISSSWNCSWCSGRCSHDCPQPAQEVVCDRPLITSFSPSSGPMVGGTEITIYGRDLGSSVEDVKDRVFVAGSRCSVIHYEISKKIVCRVEKGSSSGPIRVAIGRTSSRAAESVMLYSFVDVAVFSAYPLVAPVSGGTKITLHGQNLDAGSNVTVDIGDVPCGSIVRNSTSSLTCIVTKASSAMKARIRVKIDQATMNVPNSFEFRPDPSISSVYPLGTNFDVVQSARIFFVSSTAPPFEVVSTFSSCQIQNATFMFCLTPELLPGPHSRTAYARFPVGFAMENVTSVRNLGHRIQMRVVPDPEFAPFK
ncbi:IPT/TIG domain protein, partial [Necator americanus]